MSKSENQEDQEEERAEEPESKDKIIRKDIDRFLTQNPIGRYIRVFIGIISVISSISFIVMTNYDWSEYGECCQFQTDEKATKEQKNCYPTCE